jgi:DNA-binding transcriptional LysR family regulator
MHTSLDLRQLRAFVTLAQEGSFTRAAAKLHLTQSAISHSMKTLQEELGCALLYKSGRRILLTAHGKALFSGGEKLLHEADQVLGTLRNLDRVDRGRLRLGCSAAGSQFILPPVLREFRDCFPKYDVAVQAGDTPHVLELLEKNQIDLALGIRPADTDLFECRPIFSDELSFLASPSHPWAKSGKVLRKELGTQTYILYHRASLTFRLIEQFFLRQGIQLGSVIELGSVEAIKELVKLGIGIGVTAPWVASRELDMGSIVSLPLRPAIKRTWSVFWLKNRPLNLAEETFVGLCEAVGANLAQA